MWKWLWRAVVVAICCKHRHTRTRLVWLVKRYAKRILSRQQVDECTNTHTHTQLDVSAFMKQQINENVWKTKKTQQECAPSNSFRHGLMTLQYYLPIYLVAIGLLLFAIIITHTASARRQAATTNLLAAVIIVCVDVVWLWWWFSLFSASYLFVRRCLA